MAHRREPPPRRHVGSCDVQEKQDEAKEEGDTEAAQEKDPQEWKSSGPVKLSPGMTQFEKACFAAAGPHECLPERLPEVQQGGPDPSLENAGTCRQQGSLAWKDRLQGGRLLTEHHGRDPKRLGL